MSTVVYDKSWSPRVTLALDGGFYTATIEVEGLDPQRSVTAEEFAVGIRSLNPPTVQVRQTRNPYDAHRLLQDLSARALAAAVFQTPGASSEQDPIGPGGLLMIHQRTKWALRGAIRELGEEI